MNTPTTEAGLEVAALREALAAGPTPGPWLANLFTASFEIITPGDFAESMTLCTCYAYEEKASEMIANGMLIAAANPAAIRTVLDAFDSAIAREAATRAEVAKMQEIGDFMANAIFNLAQLAGHVLTDAECARFKELQIKWDAARSGLAATSVAKG